MQTHPSRITGHVFLPKFWRNSRNLNWHGKYKNSGWYKLISKHSFLPGWHNAADQTVISVLSFKMRHFTGLWICFPLGIDWLQGSLALISSTFQMLLDKIFGVILHYHRIIALGDRIIWNGIEESSHGLLCGTIIEFDWGDSEMP